MKSNVFTVERMMQASPDVIFAVLADPAQHSLIDGSGMLQGVVKDGESARLTLVVTFGMNMKLGISYATASTVVEFEEGRRIAWQTGPKGKLESWVAGRIWRYELEPREAGTLVRESWDISGDHQRFLLTLGDIYSKKTRRDMELTLARLDALVTNR